MCVCMCACVRACVRVCMCACVHACVCHTSIHNHAVHICMWLIASCIMCTCVVNRVPYNR